MFFVTEVDRAASPINAVLNPHEVNSGQEDQPRCQKMHTEHDMLTGRDILTVAQVTVIFEIQDCRA